MHPVPVYSLSPRQIVTAMFTKHGQTTGPDLQKLRDPLLRLLPALAELETHMNLFMLASIKLTASGHGENPYRYYEMFLESVKGFPVLRQQLSGFFTAYPTVNLQTITVLFAFLRPLIPHMMAESSASPFSGAATAPPKPTPNRRQKQRKSPKGRKHDWNTWANSGQPAFPPHFAGSFQQAQTPPAFLGQDREAAYVAELQRCYAAMAITAPAEHVFAAAGTTWNQNGSSANGNTGSRPRQFYCGLHGWNNSHNSPQCRVMLEDASYPAALRSATTHEGTGGNPRVGPPVSFRRPPPFMFVPSPSPLNTCSPACLSLNSSARARDPHPYEDTSSSQASPPLLSLKSEGHKPRRVRVLAASPSPLLSPVLCSSPLSLRPSVPWSLPLATVSVFSSSSSVVSPDKARQAEMKRQDRTRPPRTQPISVLCDPLTPPQESFSSRFAHANAFACLHASSDSDSDSDDCLSTPPKPFSPSLAIDPCPFTHLAPLSPASPSLAFRVHFDSRGLPVSEPLPFSPPLSPITAPHLSGLPSAHSVLSALITPSPLIADSGCTGLLVQLSNFPLLAPFFSPKPLPLVPLPFRMVPPSK